jgi:glucoamylase
MPRSGEAELTNSSKRCRPSLVFLMTFALMVSLVLQVGFSSRAHAAGSLATDGPGALSYFDLARKDCLGTAQNSSSKVWFTLANGVLSDVYYPTIDNTNVKTLQYVVTDGSTFTDIQTRDTTYTVQTLGNATPDCRVIATAKSGKYRITTDYVTDPSHNTVVMQSNFQALVGKITDYKLYVYYDPTINGNGGGGSGNGGGDTGVVDSSSKHNVLVAYDTNTKSNAANRDYAVPVYSALDASVPLTQETNGFLGASSDPIKQLDSSAHALSQTYAGADNGNLVQAAQIGLPGNGQFTLALGFGNTQAAAVQQSEGSLAMPFSRIVYDYELGWLIYDANRVNPHLSNPQLLREYYLSVNVVKASVDKTYPGAIAAGLAAPWGQAVSAGDPNNLYFGSYREVFARDLYEAWTALYLDGDTQTARDAVNFLFLRQQQADGSMPRNSLLNGKLAPDSFGTQLDEASYPIIMAYQLHMTDAGLYQNHIKLAANFIISHGPASGVERWEEQSGYSPSTLAAEIAGLVAAASIARSNNDKISTQLWLGVADDWQRSLEKWLVTTKGTLSSNPYYIRLSKTGDPNAAISYNLGNGGPTLDQRSVIDAGFLELVRLGLKAANDPIIAQSLKIVDSTIKSTTTSGPGWHRYNGDGYGDDASTGHPWAPTGVGTGHVWPVLTEERGEYDLASGDFKTASSLLSAMQQFASGVGLMPEQDWELPNLAPSPYGSDPTTASIGFTNGEPAGSAAPLTWAVGSYVRLALDLQAHSILEMPQVSYERYVQHQNAQTSITITTPGNLTAVSGSPVKIAGSSVAGNTIYIAATNTDNNSTTTTTSVVTAHDGTWSTTIAITGGTTIFNVVSVSLTGATGHATSTVVWDYTPGTVLFDQADASNDDNGLGNYAYPTASDFHAGAYDIQDFKVIDDGTNIVFKLQTRDLTPTFGSPLGAQLIDVYVHNPSTTSTSTVASFPARNYTIAQSAAWSQLLEVQGFGQRYVDAQGNTLGTITIKANAISRYITFSVPKSAIGQPGSGWGFTVTLTGQDGFSSDQARAFTATPGSFSFGVCATASSDAHCTFDPTKVPKVMDTLVPAGVSQSDELDYTLHSPVVLQDVTIP